MLNRKRGLILVVLLLVGGALAFALWPAATDRDWIPAHAVTPTVTFDGDHVVVQGVRNFRFSSAAPPVGGFETREYDLSRLETLWYGLSVFHPDGWRGPAHGLFSFGFDDGTYVAISVEARKEKGEAYGVLRGLLRNYELIYIVGDERDLLLDRAVTRPDDVYLFPVTAPRPAIRALFVSLLTEAERLGHKAEWYNTLTDNCTSRLRDHVNEVAPGLIPPTWRVILPGYSDKLLLNLGRLAGDEDLAAARQKYRINERARRVGDCPDFSRAIRDTSGQPAPQTEVFVMGMIHSGHRTSGTWGLDQVRETIRNIDPDVICPEIPPANWPQTLATWREKHVVEDSRVKVFPEYVDVLLPLTDEMDFVVEPSAGWTAGMARARRERMKLFETSAADSLARAAYQRDEKWVADWLAANPAPLADDDPFYIHSPAYDLRTKAELGPYEYHLNAVIGPPGGWTYINEAHFELIRQAIARHRGQRVLITFGAGHKYWFLEQLRKLGGVTISDLRPYLPGAASRPLTVRQAVEDAFLEGIAAFRAQREPLRGRPFCGAVEVVGHDADQWQLRTAVRRLGDQPVDAQWLSATLVRRPGGFLWTSVTLPDWLEEPGL